MSAPDPDDFYWDADWGDEILYGAVDDEDDGFYEED